MSWPKLSLYLVNRQKAIHAIIEKKKRAQAVKMKIERMKINKRKEKRKEERARARARARAHRISANLPHITLVDVDGSPLLDTYERRERLDMAKFIRPDDRVLELGARIGAVSCTIADILDDSGRLVVVEPDTTVIPTLEKNRSANNFTFHIYQGAVSKTPLYFHRRPNYGSFTTETGPGDPVPCTTVELIEAMYTVSFNVLVADFEGGMQKFITEFPELFKRLDVVYIEKDGEGRCDYAVVDALLIKFRFTNRTRGFREIWTKSRPVSNQVE